MNDVHLLCICLRPCPPSSLAITYNGPVVQSKLMQFDGHEICATVASSCCAMVSSRTCCCFIDSRTHLLIGATIPTTSGNIISLYRPIGQAHGRTLYPCSAPPPLASFVARALSRFYCKSSASRGSQGPTRLAHAKFPPCFQAAKGARPRPKRG